MLFYILLIMWAGGALLWTVFCDVRGKQDYPRDMIVGAVLGVVLFPFMIAWLVLVTWDIARGGPEVETREFAKEKK